MKKVLIIGAGFLQAYVIKRAKDLGYDTYALDGNPNAVGFQIADHSECINIVDEKACFEYAAANRINGVLTAATDYGVLTASYIAKKLSLNGLNYETAKLIKNKYLVRKRLCECCADTADQAYEADLGTDLKTLSETIRYPVMVKPCDGSGSRGAGKANNPDEFFSACKSAIDSSVTNRAEIESFITGNEYGVETFTENGNVHILAVMKKKMTAPPFYAELGHTVPSGLKPDTEAKVKVCAEKALQALGVNFGSVNMDLIITDDEKIHIVDIGARMGGNLIGSHIVPITTGIDYIGNMIKAAVGDETDFTPSDGDAVATRLLALSPGKVKNIPDFEKIEQKYGVKIEHHLSRGDVITPYRTNLDGCGYVVCRGDNADSAEMLAEKARLEIDKTIERE